MKHPDLMRMVEWVVFALVLYFAAMMVTNPQVQTGLWKAGHITSGAFIGYWLDRRLYGRVTFNAEGSRLVSRAIIVAAAVIGMAFGL